MNERRHANRRSRGFTLIELMVSLTIGLALLAGLVSVFVNSSQANREFHRSSEQIENGRYASDVLMNDLHHAGYYGQFFRIPDSAPFPDPCALTDAAGEITDSLPFAVQGFDAPDYATAVDLSGTSCDDWLTDDNLQPGSDALVVRRAETTALAMGAVAEANAVYLQANPVAGEIQFGAGAAITPGTRADGTTAVVMARDGINAAEIRRFRVHIYFVAPCSVPADGGEICTGDADDGGRPIPTLKRLELSADAAGTTMRTETVSEGIESIQFDYGIDAAPATANPVTGTRGDGSPERYARAPALADFPSVVTARVYVLARNTEPTVGHRDAKTYRLGLSGTLGPMNDAFKRHAYAGAVRVTNVSGRREIPQ
jgi:type IV pilus assembly protein PilW